MNKIVDNNVNGQVVPSNIRYTCEEFPARSFIEGGVGLTGASAASTRCVGMSCAPAGTVPIVKSEQNCTYA